MTDEKRFAEFEARIASLEEAVAELTSAPAPEFAPAPPPPPPLPGAAPIEFSEPPPPRPRPARQFHLDTEAVLKWGGVGLVVLAVGFGVSTAIQRGWIGPTLQLIGAVALGIALIAAGVRLRETRRPWTHALCSGGVAALLTTFASNLFLDNATTDLAFVLTVIVGLGAIGLARFVRSEWVGIVALLGGINAWMVIGDGDPPFIETGAVFVVMFVVVIVVSVEQAWFGLRLLTQLTGLVSTLGLAFASDTGSQQAAALFAAAVVATVLLSVPSNGEIHPPWRTIELQTPTFVSPWGWVVIASMFVDADTAIGLVALGSAGAVAAIALAARARLLDGHVVALLVGASVSLTIGLGFVLSTEVAWVAVAVQGVGLVVLHRFVFRGWSIPVNAGVLLVASAMWVVADGEAAWRDDASIGADIARLAVVAAIAAGAWLAGQLQVRQIGGAVVLGLSLLWLGSVLVHLPQGQAAVSLSWAVIGFAVIGAGAIRKIPEFGNAGLIVLAITVGKLLWVDMAEVDALWRAGLFLVIGLAILRLGFVLPRWTEAAGPEPQASVDHPLAPQP